MCEHWCLSQRTLVHKCMSSQTCTKRLKQGLSLWGSLKKDIDRMQCVQARQGQLGLQIWITLQVNYFRLQVNGQIRGAYCEKASKRLGSPSQVGQKSGTVSWTPATTLLLYWFKSLLSPVARTLFRQRKWAVSSLCLPQGQLLLEYTYDMLS